MWFLTARQQARHVFLLVMAAVAFVVVLFLTHHLSHSDGGKELCRRRMASPSRLPCVGVVYSRHGINADPGICDLTVHYTTTLHVHDWLQESCRLFPINSEAPTTSRAEVKFHRGVVGNPHPIMQSLSILGCITLSGQSTPCHACARPSSHVCGTRSVELDDPAVAVAGIILKSSHQVPGRVRQNGPRPNLR